MKYFFGSTDGDWYMVPVVLRKDWNEFTNNDLEDEDEIDLFNEKFGDYRVGGCISRIEFTVPDNLIIE